MQCWPLDVQVKHHPLKSSWSQLMLTVKMTPENVSLLAESSSWLSYKLGLGPVWIQMTANTQLTTSTLVLYTALNLCLQNLHVWCSLLYGLLSSVGRVAAVVKQRWIYFLPVHSSPWFKCPGQCHVIVMGKMHDSWKILYDWKLYNAIAKQQQWANYQS